MKDTKRAVVEWTFANFVGKGPNEFEPAATTLKEFRAASAATERAEAIYAEMLRELKSHDSLIRHAAERRQQSSRDAVVLARDEKEKCRRAHEAAQHAVLDMVEPTLRAEYMRMLAALVRPLRQVEAEASALGDVARVAGRFSISIGSFTSRRCVDATLADAVLTAVRHWREVVEENLGHL